MCTMRVAVLKEMLGNRETGYTLWDGKQVMEQTAKQIKDLIKSGKKVCGLTLDGNGELVLDKIGFFTTNLMEHRHCGNYKPMYDEDCMSNLFYIVIGSHKDGEDTVYDCISTKFERLTLAESDVRAYLRIKVISGGCRLNEKGEIELASLEFEKAVPTKAVVEEPKEVAEEKKEESIKAEVKEPEKPTVAEPVKVEEPKKPEQPEAKVEDKKAFFKR